MNDDNFDQYLADIMSAVYGEEVRGSIRSALEVLHELMLDSEDGLLEIKEAALAAADEAASYAAQAMATTPEGFETLADSLSDVVGDIYITQSEINALFS